MKQLTRRAMFALPVAVSGGVLLRKMKAASLFYVRLTNATLVTATQTSVTLSVCGGTPTSSEQAVGGVGGAACGVVVKWVTQADFLANGGDLANPGTFPSGIACTATDPRPLAAGACETLNIGGTTGLNGCGVIGLDCGTSYVFSLQAASCNGVQISDRVLVTASTLACAAGCTFTLGYWKTHPGAWPASGTSLTLGSVSYNQSQLLTIFNTPPKGNGLITLAHQLIAAKLNLLNGGGCAEAQTLVAQADALIGNLNILGGASLSPSSTSNLVNQLDLFNQGLLPGCPSHCA
jgi:hypothetical protein